MYKWISTIQAFVFSKFEKQTKHIWISKFDIIFNDDLQFELKILSFHSILIPDFQSIISV